MRYHHARVVLAACLTAATAAAQAPGTFDGIQPQGAARDNAAPAAPPADGTAAKGGFAMGSGLRTASLVGSDFAARMQDPDYTLLGLFQTSHGEFMNRRERYDPDIEFRGRLMPDANINHEQGNFDLLGYEFDIEAPAPVSTDGFLLFGAYYQGRDYQFSDAFGMTDETLMAAGLTLGFGVFLDDNVLLEVETNPGVWSDADGGLHHKDYDFPSSALFTIRTIDNFFLKIGARYNQIYEDAPWLPYLGFAWEMSETMRLDVLAPESIELSIWPSGDLGILFGGEVTGGEYHVRTSEATGNLQGDVHVQEIVAYAGLMLRMSDNVSLWGKAGALLTGDYDLTTGDPTFNRKEGSLDTSLFFEIGFGIDF